MQKYLYLFLYSKKITIQSSLNSKNPNLPWSTTERQKKKRWKIQSIDPQVTTLNVLAILSVPDSTIFCILFSTSLLLLPTFSYIVVFISGDHPPPPGISDDVVLFHFVTREPLF